MTPENAENQELSREDCLAANSRSMAPQQPSYNVVTGLETVVWT